MPTNFQIPEFVQGYMGLVDIGVLQSVGGLLIFVMVIISIAQVRNLRKEVASLQESVFTIVERRSLAESRAKRETGTSGGFAAISAGTSLKLALNEVELEALKDMVTELRQARDDWKAQAARLAPSAPTTAPTPAAARPAPPAAPPTTSLSTVSSAALPKSRPWLETPSSPRSPTTDSSQS